jgi:hypothetical protein
MITVKFWFFSPAGELVKIKMRAGQVVRHHWHAPTDEGWSSEDNQFTFDGVRIEREWFSDGVDCDGRLQGFGESFFFAHEATAGNALDGVHFPKWQGLVDCQRDHFAEAMGY